MKTTSTLRTLALALTCLVSSAFAQTPQLINYQGRVAVGTANFEGTGLFKFALVNTDGTTTYWSNDGSSSNGLEPSASVSIPVSKGLYSVLLGSNMQAVPATVFANSDVRLRVWFNDGVNGSQLLTPDQRIAAVGYALVASTAETAQALADGISITAVNANFTGNVGVGTNNLVSPVTIQTGSASYGLTHTDDNPILELRHRISTYVDDVGAQIGAVSNTPLGLFASDGSYQFIIYPAFTHPNNPALNIEPGRVGIGTPITPIPAEKLTVNGNVQAGYFIGNGSRLTGINGGAGNFGNNTNQAVEGDGAPGTVGQIVLSAGPIANGVPCSGQLLSRTTYSVLFSVIGTQFGAGDGTTTFGVPDLRAVAPNNLTYSILATGSVPDAVP